MVYRTKTYIAADWDGDSDAINQLYTWKNNGHLTLDFQDAHDLTQARDGSLNCSIKKSLASRLDASKTFVLIVGNGTKSVRSGSCRYCNSYNSWTQACTRNYSVDYCSYVEYECQKAVKDNLTLIILYNAASVDKSKCPNAIRAYGTHSPMQKMKDGKHFWDYQSVKNALGQS